MIKMENLRDDIKIAALCANENVALIEKQIKGERKFKVKNPIKVLNPGGKIKLSKNITLGNDVLQLFNVSCCNC